jgi:hypothetical protein
MNLKLYAYVHLEHLRIEVTDLIFKTFSLSLDTAIDIQHLADDTDQIVTSPDKATSTLHRLRRLVLIFLADICASHPISNSPGICPRPGVHETLFSCTSFLAYFVKHHPHPEEDRKRRGFDGTGQVDHWKQTAHDAPWKKLKDLRPR